MSLTRADWLALLSLAQAVVYAAIAYVLLTRRPR